MLPYKAKSGIFEASTNKNAKVMKSGVSDTSSNKSTPATPRVSKLGRPGSTKSDSASPSPLQNSRLPIDRSPKSVDSKSAAERRPLKLSTAPDKQPRAVKGSELQVQLGIVQEDLKKAREQLALVEQEKARAVEELKDAKRLADEISEKLTEALVAQKKAEESSEIEKFRAVELEQAGIEAVNKREEELQKELNDVENQHAVDLAALLSTTQELQRIEHDLAMTVDAKNTALSHADDAMKIAEINADRVMVLSGEVSRLKALLDTKMENVGNETTDLMKKLDSEVDALKYELQNAKAVEEKLIKMEDLVEALKIEVTYAKSAETDAGKLVDEWKKKAEFLEAQVEEANVSENKTGELLKKMNSQIDALRQELVRAQTAEEKLVETELLVEQLSTEVTDAKRAEADAAKLADEWKSKAELSEVHVEEANQSKNETLELVNILDSKIEAMKHELERAKSVDDKLVEMEALVDRLRSEVSDAKRAETDACKLIDEWKRKAELLEVRVEEADQSKKSSLDTLASVSKQLEESNASLQDAESEIAALKGIIVSLELEVTRHKTDFNKSEHNLDIAQQEKLELENTVELLKSELRTSQEEKLQALENVKVATSNIESVSEERNKLVNELEISNNEGDKAKKAMEGLASALHEVSSEARETQERLLAKQAESEDAYELIEELKLTLKNTEERYEVLLDEARYEIVCLRNSVERHETESKTLRSEFVGKELEFGTSIKNLEEDLASLKDEKEKLVVSLKGVEHEAHAAREAEAELTTKLREAETEMMTKSREAEAGMVTKLDLANEVAEAAMAETLHLKESLLDKENEVQSITQENDDLRIREAANLEKVRELSVLLAEATAKRTEQNGYLMNSDNEYDILPNTKDFQEIQISDGREFGIPMPEATSGKHGDSYKEDTKPKENGDGNHNDQGEAMELETNNWKTSEVMDKVLSLETKHEAESTDDELESKIDSSSSSSFDHVNGLSSEKMENGVVQQKKKKALLHKFGHLLKKKNNHK